MGSAEHRRTCPAAGRRGQRVELHEADATRVAAAGSPLDALRGTVDVVVTNPPYVPDAAIPREPEVRDHDPGLALYGGPDGLDIVRPLAEQAALLLRPGGLLLVEHADVQGEDAGESGVPFVLRSQPEPAGNNPALPTGDPGEPQHPPRPDPARAVPRKPPNRTRGRTSPTTSTLPAGPGTPRRSARRAGWRRDAHRHEHPGGA